MDGDCVTEKQPLVIERMKTLEGAVEKLSTLIFDFKNRVDILVRPVPQQPSGCDKVPGPCQSKMVDYLDKQIGRIDDMHFTIIETLKALDS